MQMADAEPVVRAGPFTKILIKIAGVDEETLRLCPPHDWDHARAIGLTMVATFIYQAGLFTIVGERLFAAPGQFRPGLVLVAILIAAFIQLIDSVSIMASSWHLAGIEELKRGGLDISGGPGARIKAGFYLVVRVALSIGIAQLTAIFVSLLIFAADIDARIEGGYLQANAGLIDKAAALVDADIARATAAVTAESARIDALSAQVTAVRQNGIDPSAGDPQLRQAQQEMTELLAEKAKADEAVRNAETFASNELAGIRGAPDNSGLAGAGPRRKAAIEAVANAKTRARDIDDALNAARARLDALHKRLAVADDRVRQGSRDQLPAFEKALADETTVLANLKDGLASLTKGRDDAIRSAVENAPDHVRRDDGFLAQITALEHVVQNDNKIEAVVILIDVTSFGFELAAVLAKVTSFVPTTYAALLARDGYMRVVRIVEEMAGELEDGTTGEETAAPPRMSATGAGLGNGSILSPSPFEASEGLSSPAPKRPRGRPRKSSLN